jgi:DNA-binding transcriptional regulator YiaG
MSNQLAVTLEKEVARVTQNELKRALAALHAEVTALKRKVEAQERKLESVATQTNRRAAAAAAKAAEEGPPLDPTTIRAIRKRLGLSQANLAQVVSVTPVAVYFWEAGRTTPKGQRREALLELKSMGKKQAQARLAAAQGGKAGPARKTKAKAGARKTTARRRKPARKK